VGYVLGVDLGTTFSAAAIVRDGVAQVCTLGLRATALPSVVFLRDDGELLIGDAAERRSVSDPERVAREFKRRMGDPTPILLGGSPFSAHALTGRLLRSVVDQVTATEGGPPERIVVTRPANWGEYKQELFAQALHQADIDAMTVTEPEAAAVHYAAAGRLGPGAVVAVYDLGGGTFDATVLRNTGERFELLGTPLGIEQLGGVDFDDAVFRFAVDSLGPAVSELDPEDQAALAALARLRRDCVEAKEALSSDTETTISAVLPTVQRDLRLTRGEFEALIRPALLDTVSMLERALRSADVDAAALTAVLLVGGSSRIPLVSQLLTERLGAPVGLDLHPKHAVALGAAHLASVMPATPANLAKPANPNGGAVAPAQSGPVLTKTRAATPPAPAPAPPPGPARAPASAPARNGAGRIAWLLAGVAALSFILVGIAGAVWVGANRRHAQGSANAPAIDLAPAAADTDKIKRPTGEPLSDDTIVYTHESEGKWNIWAVKADGSDNRPLTSEQAVRVRLPALSPDRRTIAYTETGDGTQNLYLIDTQAAGKQRVASELAADARAAWSPDMTRLVFVAERGGQRDLTVVDLRTEEETKLTDNAEEEGDPAWSPDGSKIVYWSGNDLWTVGSAGGPPTRLTSSEGQEADPAWSPDGSKIAYAAKPTGRGWDIVVADANGRNAKALSPGAATRNGDEQDPTWSPDGQRIAFETKRDAQASNPATDDAEIYVVAVTGENPVRLTTTGGYDGHPAWGTGATPEARERSNLGGRFTPSTTAVSDRPRPAGKAAA
jgi:molecular chaperone DnaK